MLVVVITCLLLSFNGELGASLLVASWKIVPGGIGIPGLTKTYEATLTNNGILPVRVTVCDFVTDAFEHGKHVAYSIERWDQKIGRWQFFWGMPQQEFCKPYPTGITSNSKIRLAWLWPQQGISTGFVAIQASDRLNLNDRLRFTITPFLTHTNIAVVTPSFVVDERPIGSAASGSRIGH
jgi:hypothetical protein